MQPTNLLFIFALQILNGFFAFGETDLSIQHVHVLFRHGDRSPVVGLMAPDVPFEQFWPFGRGQLTKLGVLQEFELGRWLRSRYTAFPAEYNASDFHMRSTDIDRTLMSAQAVLAGFYHNITSPLSKYQLNWLPIPVHTVLQKNDLLLSEANCPRLDLLRDLQMNSPASLDFEFSHRNLLQHLKRHTTRRKVNRFNVWEISDAVTCMQAHNYPLPAWLNQSVVDELRVIEEYYWKLKLMSTDEILQMEIGVFLHSMFSHILSIVDGKPHPSTADYSLSSRHLMAYSAHDTDVSWLLGALKLWDGQLINYSAAIGVELLGPNHPDVHEKFRIRVWYKRGWTDEKSEYLQFPICKGESPDTGCQLSKIVQ